MNKLFKLLFLALTASTATVVASDDAPKAPGNYHPSSPAFEGVQAAAGALLVTKEELVELGADKAYPNNHDVLAFRAGKAAEKLAADKAESAAQALCDLDAFNAVFAFPSNKHIERQRSMLHNPTMYNATKVEQAIANAKLMAAQAQAAQKAMNVAKLEATKYGLEAGMFRTQVASPKVGDLAGAEYKAQSIDRTSSAYRLHAFGLKAKPVQVAKAQTAADKQADKAGVNGWFFGAMQKEMNAKRGALPWHKQALNWLGDHKLATGLTAGGIVVATTTGTVLGIAATNRQLTDKWLRNNKSVKNNIIRFVRALGLFKHRSAQTRAAAAA